jgi:hypothetical protein
MLHVAAPEDDEARLQFLFFGDKRHVRLPVLCRFRADSSRKSLNPLTVQDSYRYYQKVILFLYYYLRYICHPGGSLVLAPNEVEGPAFLSGTTNPLQDWDF